MSHFRLHTKGKERNYLLAGAVCVLLAAVVAGYVVHSIGTARAKSRETVLIYTEEELEQYLLDQESEEYNLNGRYQLEEDLDLGWLSQSIGTNIEPFTGTFDGNGHVISGLKRPLFGVLEKAEIENLFLRVAEITQPSIYYDGEMYVDGYGALAAYSVGAIIQNCGMEGEIHTASPVEAEYLLEKASPAEADVPSTGRAKAEAGPGIETAVESGAEPGGKGSSGAGGDSGTEAESGSDIGAGSDFSGVAGTETSSSENAEAGAGTGGSTGTESGAEQEPETSGSTGVEQEPETGGTTGTEQEPETGGSTGAEQESGTSESTGTEQEPEIGGNTEKEPGIGTSESAGADVVTVSGNPNGTILPSETIGFQMMDRQYLRLKISPVIDRDAESVVETIASPSNAESTEIETDILDESTSGQDGDTASSGADMSVEDETEIEYIGNPNGDVRILVTAERVAAGGLIAEMAGESLLSDSFVLVTIDSHLDMADSYAGGMVGIAGAESRLENSYAVGFADTDGVTGGFAAVNHGEIQNCYCVMTIGTEGLIRGAFAASGEGTLSGCVYDRQMSCVEEETESEFSLQGLNTNRMTGLEPEIPGNWYLVEHAYPQLEYFALNSQEVIESCSKAAAIALALPEHVTLKDMLEEGDLVLPSEVDGCAITWEAEGNLTIDENNQVVLEPGVSISPNEILEVKNALDTRIPQAQEESMESEHDLTAEENSEESIKETTGSETDTTNKKVQLKASVRGISRNFPIQAGKVGNTLYPDWSAVGKAVDTGGALESYQPTLTGDSYDIGTPEALAWFAYKVNSGDSAIQTAGVRLTADIELDGETNYEASKSSPLPWIPIGVTNDSTCYKGVFDGNGHTIDYLKVNQDGYAGLFARAGGGAVIRKLGIGPNSTVAAMTGTAVPEDGTAAFVGGVIAESGAAAQLIIEGCYSRASVAGKSVNTGAFVGNGAVSSPGNQKISNCYNAGSITIKAGGSGTASAIAGTFVNDTALAEGGIQDCYWDAAKTGAAVTAACSSGSSLTMERTKQMSEEDMKKGETVVLLNHSLDSKVWSYHPWDSLNDGYPVYDDGTVWNDWSQVGAKMDAASKFPEGGGTSASPYLIKNAEELAWFSYRVGVRGYTGIYGKLVNDIDLFGSEYTGFQGEHTQETIDSALKWYPIGNEGRQYKGVFDGNGHVIEGMLLKYIGADSLGFFGWASNARIQYMGIGKSCKAVQTAQIGNLGLFVGSVANRTVTYIDNCFNLGSIDITDTGVYHTGAFVGDDKANASARITNCYNAGDAYGFASVNTTAPVNCYADITVNGKNANNELGALSGVKKLNTTQMKSWAVVYALNGQSMDGPWKYIEGEYPGFGTLDRPSDWSAVGQGIEDGLITSGTLTTGEGTESSPYNISSAEQLAAFAAKVNSGNPKNTSLGTAVCASLTSNIDLTGMKYKGSASQPIPWRPIGTGTDTVVNESLTETNIYKGIFEGNGKIIANMKVEQEGYGGLFGCVGGGAVIRCLGLDASCSVKTIASESANSCDGTAAFVGALKSVAGADPQLVIEYCYNRASVHGKSANTGAFVGVDEGTASEAGAGEQRITNCYTTGLLTTESGEAPGAIAGSFANGVSPNGGIQYCYWDGSTSSSSGVKLQAAGQGNAYTVEAAEKTTAELKDNAILGKLNSGAAFPIWELSTGRNNGYPTFKDIPVFDDWGVVGGSVSAPASQSTASPGTKNNPYLIYSAEDLAWFAYQVNHSRPEICGKLMDDISLFGGIYTGGNAYDDNDNEILARALRWIPIGSDVDGQRYTGTFDGNGFTVSKMRVSETEKQGLFGTLGSGADIKNIAVATSLLNVTQYAGGVAGYINGSNVTITGCHVSGSLSGTGNYFGGIIGGSGDTTGTVIDGCYISTAGIITSSDGAYVGGILGGTGSGSVSVRNCYNRGRVMGKSQTGGIAGGAAQTSQTVLNCYNAGIVSGDSASTGGIAGAGSEENIQNCFYESTASVDGYATAIETERLKSWAAAWKLNGDSISQSTGISWHYDSDYPYPAAGSGEADDWEEVARAVEFGFLGTIPTGTPLAIGTAEELAWYAYQVNQGKTYEDVVLTTDLNLVGSSYRASGMLPWVPIGKDKTTIYTGTFDGNGYAIDNMKLEAAGSIGLFGCAGGGTVVSNLGIGSGSTVVSTGTREDGTAALIGAIETPEGDDGSEPQVTIKGCYNRASVTGSGYTGAFVGRDNGIGVNKTQLITGCYTTGKIDSKETGMAYAIAGTFSHGTDGAGGIRYCYWDRNTSGTISEASETGEAVKESDGKSTAEMKGIETITAMNRLLSGKLWCFNLPSSGTNDGYPVMKTMVLTWADIGQMQGSTVPDGMLGNGSAGNPYQLDSAEDLAWFAYQVNSGNLSICGRLTADIQLFGSRYIGWAGEETLENISHALEWYPIGNSDRMYGGTFDGNGHEIDGLYISSGESVGLFGYVKGSTIQNLGIGRNSRVDGGTSALFVGRSDTYVNSVIQNCYNLGTSRTGIGAAFLGDDVGSYGGKVFLKNCYNAGNTLMIARISSGVIENCYADITVCETNIRDDLPSTATVGLTTTQMKSWAAAYALNGQKMDQDGGISWTYDPDGEKYPTFGTLPKAENWEQVAQGMVDGLILKDVPSGNGDAAAPYQIESGEQLAWFAYQMNHGADQSLHAELTKAAISLAGAAYGGDESRPIPWKPIETYSGTFGASQTQVSQIQALHVNTTGNAGLFGTVTDDGKVAQIGIANASITGSTAGAVAGQIEGNALISRCYNRSEDSQTSHVTATGNSSARAGGIVGQIADSARVEDSYNLNTAIEGTGTASCAGGIAGGITDGGAGSSKAAVSNCYSTGGTVTAVAGSGAIVGTAGEIAQCYSSGTGAKGTGQAGTVVTADEMKTQLQTDNLNTLADGTERMKNSGRVWYTSLLAEVTGGYPTLEAPVMLTVSANIEEIGTTDTSPWKPADVTGGLSSLPADVMLRGIHQENSSSAAFTLTDTGVVKTKMNAYGYTLANSNLGLLAGTVDLQTLEGYASLTEPSASGTVGSFSQMTLYHGAAYTEALPRAILVDLASGTTRYEIRVEIPGVSTKMLSVVLPVKVAIELHPDGNYHKSYSGNLKLANDNAYPVEGRILSVNAIEKEGYVTLHPVDREIRLEERKGQITDENMGVKLGIGNPDPDTTPALPAVLDEELYYKPGATETENCWMYYLMKNSGTFWYRYFVEYQSDPYYFSDLNNYGYTVEYQFCVAEGEYTESNEAVVRQ